MLLNLWMDDSGLTCALEGPPRTTWDETVLLARAAALDGRFDLAEVHLRGLQSLLAKEPSRAAPNAEAVVRLELARLPSPRGYLQSASRLERFLQDLEKAEIESRMKTALRVIAYSERELVQVLLRVSSNAWMHLSEAPREMAFNRLRAVSEFKLRHPVIGLLNLHLAVASHRLKDHVTALDYLAEANACFTAPQETSERFTHERSDVLLAWSEVAVDLGNLDQAEALLQQVLVLKDAGARRPISGILLGNGGERVTDRLGLAKCHGILAKLQHCQGRFDQALESYAEDARLSGKSRDLGFVANRRGQIYLDAGAYNVAEHVFKENARRKDGALLNRVHARFGLARTILVRSIPGETSAVPGPRQVQFRREARREAVEVLDEAAQSIEKLQGPNRREVEQVLTILRQVCAAHECLDTHNLERYIELRRMLLHRADDQLAQHDLLGAADLFATMMRLELWAWRMHGHVVPGEEGLVYDRLLDLWERLGAHERLTELQRWGEEAGFDDVHRILLRRYLPQVARGQEVQPARQMTVLFADLRDYSGHCQLLGQAERIAELEADLFRVINPVVQEHRGAILRYQGDSILVVFNLDGGQPNHADQAAECALAMQKAVQRLNSLRSSYDPTARPLVLAIGLHSGKVAATHLQIPGRREVTVFGNPVNLSKRIQETAKDFPQDTVLASGETVRKLRQTNCRPILLAARRGFKGYQHEEVRLDVYALRPVVPLRTSFAGVGSSFTSCKNLLVLDVGNTLKDGILDHHQPGVEGSAAELVFKNPHLVRKALGCDSVPDERPDLELVLHAGPDFDCCAATLLALEVLENSASMAWSPGMQALAEYATRIDSGKIELGEEPAASPYALFACFDEALRSDPSNRGLSQLELDRRSLEGGVQLLHAGVRLYDELPCGTNFVQIFQGRVPPRFERTARQAREDQARYREHDAPRIEERRYAVPSAAQDFAGIQHCAVITDPQSALFKVWARQAGYVMLVVEYLRSNLELLVAGRPVSIPLRRFVISVLPDSRLTLAALGARLEKEEKQRRAELAHALGASLFPSGPNRPGFDSPDPWYDGRSATLAHTIVDAPRSGSVLTRAEILGILDNLYARGPEAPESLPRRGLPAPG